MLLSPMGQTRLIYIYICIYIHVSLLQGGWLRLYKESADERNVFFFLFSNISYKARLLNLIMWRLHCNPGCCVDSCLKIGKIIILQKIWLKHCYYHSQELLSQSSQMVVWKRAEVFFAWTKTWLTINKARSLQHASNYMKLYFSTRVLRAEC